MLSSVAGEIYSWGSNRRGQLGPLTSNVTQRSLKMVPNPTRVELTNTDATCCKEPRYCSAGANHSAIITG